MGQSTLASAWMLLTEKKPLLGYFIAVGNGWVEEALASARQLVQTYNTRDLATRYEPKMETISSHPYRRLLAYAQACRDAASADFELRDLPARRCPSWCGCHARYPQALSTASPSEWLHGHFKVARDALRGRPCRTQIQSDCVDSPFVVSFKAIVVIDRPPCTQENNRMNSRTSPYAGKIPIMWQCTAQDNLVWAETVLRRYVAAVDRAVGQVSPSVRRRAFISPLIPWCYCSG